MGYLIGAGANINGRSPRGHTALKWTAFHGDISAVEILLGEGANVNNDIQGCQGGRLMTALQLASYGGHVKLVRLLLDACADVNAIPGKHLRDSFTGSALQAAVTLTRNDEKLSVTKMLLKAEGTIDVSGSEDVDFVSRCELGPYTTVKPETIPARNPFVVAIENEDVAQINSLLLDCTLIHQWLRSASKAIEHLDLEMTGILLDAGIDHYTLMSRKEILYYDYFDITYVESALGAAIRLDTTNDLPLIRMLLDAGADPNAIVNESYGVALSTAIRMSSFHATKLLIQCGADVNSWGGSQYSPLQVVAGIGSLDLVKRLLNAGVGVNAPPAGDSGATALRVAAMHGFIGIACLLLEKGAEVNAPPAKKEGRTALEGAAEHSRIDMLQLLLNRGAKVKESGEVQFDRALSFARRQGHHAAVRLLQASYDRCA